MDGVRGAIPIGSIFGVHIRIHWTFFLLAVWFVGWAGARGDGRMMLSALALLVGVFTCVVLHELGHSLAAIRFGAKVESITLLPIGGVAFLRQIPVRPVQEFLVALAGPAVNVILFFLLALIRGGFPSWVGAFLLPGNLGEWLETLMRANVVMAVFNLVPAFPMDGGRVLRGLLGFFLPHHRATAWAAGIGRILALGFMALGLVINPLLSLIGLVVFFGAGREDRMAQVKHALQSGRVRDAMITHPVILHPGDPLERCREAAIHRHQDGFVVEQDGRLVGILPARDWVDALRKRGPQTPVGEVMRRHFLALHPDAELNRVYSEVRREGQGLFPVIENGQLVGLLSAAGLERFLVLRELGVGVRWQSGRVPGRGGPRVSRFSIDLG